MHKRRSSLIKHVMFVALVVLSIAGLWGWSIEIHNRRREQFEKEEIRVEIEQDAADRAAGIIPIEDLIEEEYE